MSPWTARIASWEYACGVGGYLLVAASFYLDPRAVPLSAYALTAAFLAVCIAAGRRLRSGSRAGITLSLAVQLLQSVHIASRGLYAVALSGPFIDLRISNEFVALRAGGAALAMIFPPDASTPGLPGWVADVQWMWRFGDVVTATATSISVNVVAVFFAWQLAKALRQLPSEPSSPESGAPLSRA